MNKDSQYTILFVDHTPFSGGAQLVLAEHIAELDTNKFRPIVACTNDVPELPEKYRAAGAEVIIVEMPKLKRKSLAVIGHFIDSIKQIRTLIRQNEVDLVVSNTTRTSYIASLAVLGLRIPVVWWVRDYLYPKFLFNLLQIIPNRIIFVSKSIKLHYMSESNPKGVVVYVANNLYKRLAEVSSEKIAQERQKWGFSHKDIVVGFMGRLVAEKGAEDVILGVIEASKGNPNIKALIVGTGKGQMNDVEMQLYELVKEKEAQNSVVFAGYQQNEALYYSLIDIFVLATRDHEPFATSVVQAMMAEKPVIGTDAGGTSELVINNETGVLVPPANHLAMSEAIVRLVDDEKLRRTIAKNGHARVLQYHREEVVTDVLESIYLEILTKS